MKSNVVRPVGSIDENSVKKTCEFLNTLLANEFTLFTKTLNYHWNVTGPRFHSLHVFLEEQYNELLTVMDEVAERVRVLGETPISTVNGMNQAKVLSEKNGNNLSSNDMLQDLLTSNIRIQDDIREFVCDREELKRDPGTEDFLIALLQKHEMKSWMLKSHLDY